MQTSIQHQIEYCGKSGEGRVLLKRKIEQEEKHDVVGLGIPFKRDGTEGLMVNEAPLLLGVARS